MKPNPFERRLPLALAGALALSGLSALCGSPALLGLTGCSGAAPPQRVAPKSPAPPAPPAAAFGPAAIDALARAAWQRAGVTPAGRVDDAGFLRRASLDITGALPPPDVVTAFLADPAPDKRRRAVEALLASARYADHWTDSWEDLFLGQRIPSNVVDREAFRRWLHGQIEANTGWDELAAQLITATGRNSVGGPRGPKGSPESDAEADAREGVNGAVNWLLRYQRAPQDLPAAASRLFLGVQIQCAQCHDHKTEKWTQSDFQSFAACFAQTRVLPVGEKPDKGVRAVDIVDAERPRRGKRRAPNRAELDAISASAPKALDGTELSGGGDRRKALAAWMTAPGNPWFARAIVNRMWATLVGRGFVEPIDDLRPGNAPVVPELFDALARDFIAHGHDLKHLIGTIAATEVYQLAAAPPRGVEETPADRALWSSFRARPMPPDVLLTAILAATGLDPVLERVAGERRDQVLAQMRAGFDFLFDVDEEQASDAYEGTVQQALVLLNGSLTAAGASAAISGTALAQVLAAPGDDAQKIEALYLRTLSRRPSAAEVERWVRYVNEPRDAVEPVRGAPPAEVKKGRPKRALGEVEVPAGLKKRLGARPGTAKEQAYEDLFWALLNSGEFFFNH